MWTDSIPNILKTFGFFFILYVSIRSPETLFTDIVEIQGIIRINI